MKPPWRGSNPRPGTKTIPLTLTAGERALNAWVLVRIEERERRSGCTWWPWCSGSAWCAVNASVPDRNRPVTQRNKLAVGKRHPSWPGTRKSQVRVLPARRRPHTGAARELASRPPAPRGYRWGGEMLCKQLAEGSIPSASTIGLSSGKALDSKSDERGSIPRRPANGGCR